MFTKDKSLSTDLSTSIPQRRSIFAIFVHFGKSETTNTAIASIMAGTLRPDHVIVVDHADDIFYPTEAAVACIRPKENGGYVAGLRAGLSQAAVMGAVKHDICLLLNNDVVFDVTNIQDVSNWWQAHGGPQVLAGASGGYVSLLSGRAHVLSRMEKKRWWSIQYVHGSCMVGEFGLVASLPFPTSLFMYWEDVLMSLIVQQRGGHLAVIPGLHTIHNDAVTPVSSVKLYYLVRNGAYVLERYSSPIWRAYWYGVNSLRVAFHTAYGTSTHTLIARALRAGRGGNLGKADV